MSTSAVTITGLSATSNLTDTYTLFGIIVLIFLVQVGGLSIITLSIYILMIFGGKIDIATRDLIKESFNQNTMKGLLKLIKRVVLFTLVVEVIGAILFFIVFIKNYNFVEAIGVSLFHSISSLIMLDLIF